jgi:hypothetical protein
VDGPVAEEKVGAVGMLAPEMENIAEVVCIAKLVGVGAAWACRSAGSLVELDGRYVSVEAPIRFLTNACIPPSKALIRTRRSLTDD